MDRAELLIDVIEFMNSRNESLNQNKTVKELIDDFFIEATPSSIKNITLILTLKFPPMIWYKTLDIHTRINVKQCFELLTGVKFEDLSMLFTFRERIEIMHTKLQMEGFIL